MPFVKGVSGNPNGRPRNAETDLLREALRKQGEKRGVDFWDKVAEFAFRDKQVMVAIIKKFVPDININQLEGELKGDTKVVIIKETQSGNKDSEGRLSRQISIIAE